MMLALPCSILTGTSSHIAIVMMASLLPSSVIVNTVSVMNSIIVSKQLDFDSSRFSNSLQEGKCEKESWHKRHWEY